MHKLILIRSQEELSGRCQGFFYIARTSSLKPRLNLLWTATQTPFALFLYHVIIEQLLFVLKGRRFLHQ